jgi:tetratricopeptide (TPR) repeat protein
MLFLRVLFLALIFTAVGVGVLFYDKLKPIAEGTYAYYRADSFYARGDYENAKTYYEAALKGYPVPEDALVKLGDTALQLDEPGTAMAAYQKAMEVAPQSKIALTRVARQQWMMGNQEVALELYEDALKQAPEDAALRANLGDLYLSIAHKTNDPRDFEKVESMYKDFLEKNKDDDIARYKLAESLFAQGHYNEALDIYCELTAKHPESPETLYSLSVSFAKSGDYDEAAMYMARAAEYAESNHLELSQKWAHQAVEFEQERKIEPGEPSEATSRCLKKLVAMEKEQSESAKAESN